MIKLVGLKLKLQRSAYAFYCRYAYDDTDIGVCSATRELISQCLKQTVYPVLYTASFRIVFFILCFIIDLTQGSHLFICNVNVYLLTCLFLWSRIFWTQNPMHCWAFTILVLPGWRKVWLALLLNMQWTRVTLNKTVNLAVVNKAAIRLSRSTLECILATA